MSSRRPPHLRVGRYQAVLGAAVLCYAALGAVLSIIPRYVPEQLGGGAVMVGLAVGAPAFTALLTRPLGGRLADRRLPLYPVTGGALLMAAGGIAAALSTTLYALLVTRLVAGAGEGLMMSATVLWLLRLAGPRRRGRALGHIGLANYAGLAVGPLLATALGGPSASRTVLWAAVVLLAVPGLGMLALRRVPDDQHGAAAGLFFSWFDAGVGLGGPAVGAVASLAGPPGALTSAAAAVAATVLIGLSAGGRAPSILRSRWVLGPIEIGR